jgi:glucosamine--fructose-6-phosphate aminotransferase (isomerizing)
MHSASNPDNGFDSLVPISNNKPMTADFGQRNMDFKQPKLDTPGALRETLEKGRPEFESLIRRVRWDEEPVFMVGTGSSFPCALTGALAFGTLLGWKVIAQTAIEFKAHTLPLLRPRSVVVAISNSGKSSETLEAASAARAKGTVVLALTNDAASELAKMADLAFLLRAGKTDESTGRGATSLGAVLCQQAAIGYIGLVAAQTLKRHHPQFDVLEEEFAKLPALVEWIQSQMLNAVRALASEVKGSPNLSIVGGGFYHPVALQAVLLLKELLKEFSPVQVAGIEPMGFDKASLHPAQKGAAVLFLSGSHFRSKKNLHALARSVKKAGMKIFSVTDHNDRELSASSTFSLLLPELTEMVGSMLALALIQSVAVHVARDPGSCPVRGPAASAMDFGRP